MAKAIIIGAGLGGLATAIQLRLAGLQVRVFEKNALCGGRANQLKLGGFTFDTGPSLLNYPWVFESLFRQAGQRLYDKVELREVEPGIRFYWPDGDTLSLSSRFDTLLAELARFDPAVGPRLARWLERTGRNYRLSFARLVTNNADSPRQWLAALRIGQLAGLGLQRSLYRQLALSFKSRRIREALGSYAMYLGGSPFDLPGLFEILPYGEINYGLWLPRGGIYSLVLAIAGLAREFGADIRTDTTVNAILASGNRVAGVRLADGDRQRADVVVSNCDLPTTDCSLLPPGPAQERGRKRADRLLMTPAVITYYWGLKRRVQGLGHHSIFLPDDYHWSFKQLMQGRQISGKPPFYTAVATATVHELAPGGKSTMFVLVPVPVLSRLPEVDWQRETDRVKRYVLERISYHGCNISAGDIEEECIYMPADWQRSFGLFDGSAFGASHRLLMMGPWRPANRNRYLPGLFYAGASTTPGTGLPMVTLSGAMTAERVMQYVH